MFILLLKTFKQILDVPNGFDVWGIDGLSSDETGELRKVTVATNETIELYCGAASHYSDSVVWLGINLDSEGNFLIKNTKHCIATFCFSLH